MNIQRANFPLLRGLAVWVALTLTFLGPIAGQELTYLALQRPGQASIAIDHKKATAYVTDLGKAGDGDQATLDRTPILDRLVELGVRNLVFTCSHPHSDHMGGIRALFENPTLFFADASRTVPRFKSITVIDDQIPKPESLFDILKRNLGKNSVIRTEHISAQRSNAFADLSTTGDAIFIENVPFDSRTEASPHGRSVVTHLVLGGKHSIVDFDDANSDVVRETVGRLETNGTKINSFVVPHHGSAFHDIEPILALGPQRAVIAVNARNPYSHPAPEILLKLMDLIGPSNVLFTGSLDQITFNPDGVEHARYTAADMDSYDLFIKPGYERAKRRGDLTKVALYEQVRTRMQGASALLKPDRAESGNDNKELVKTQIDIDLAVAEQNADNILSLADKLALSTNAMPAEKLQLDRILQTQRRVLENLDTSVKAYESQDQSELVEERNRLARIFSRTPDGSVSTLSKPDVSVERNEKPTIDSDEDVGLALDNLDPRLPIPVLSNRNVKDVRFVANLTTVRTAAPAINVWKQQAGEEVPSQLFVPFSTVLNPTTTKQRPGGISIGNKAEPDATLDLRSYLLTYDSTRKSILLKGPGHAELRYPPPIDAAVLKAVYRYAASDRNAAVSMSFSTSGAFYRIIRLDPAFVDTAVGRDLIASDLIGWELRVPTLPDGSANPFADDFSRERSDVFRCIGKITAFSDLIDKPTKIRRTDTTLVLIGGMNFQYMADLPSSVTCPVIKCKSGVQSQNTCHFINLESFTAEKYPAMLKAYPALARVDQYARLISFLRWARHSGSLAGIDFSALAAVPASGENNRTPDAIEKND